MLLWNVAIYEVGPLYLQNLGLLRTVIMFAVLALVFAAQCYWFIRGWRLAGRAKAPAARRFFRTLWVGAFALLIFCMVFFGMGGRPKMWRWSALTAWTGLWLSSALFAFLAVQIVAAAAWAWDFIARVIRSRRPPAKAGALAPPASPSAPADTPVLADPGRRRFVQAATVVAGAVPFAATGYGFAFERLHYDVRRIDVPIANLPPALSGLRIAQLSDIHIGSYMSASEVRRAVDLANSLGADLTVVTGDFLTSTNDPLEACIAELSRLRAPLGVWGCNGNHEIYAGVEALSAELFERHGMRLLRQQSAELIWRGRPFNLLGVDYQRERNGAGIIRPMLRPIEKLVRRDVPNILLSHNPNSFRRAAELGIELMLAGHTHGGQVTLEILDHRLSAARFLTPYIAGLYARPVGTPADVDDDAARAAAAHAGAATGGPAQSFLYVNRGLGTIGMPVRLGVPPEITLHTLRRA